MHHAVNITLASPNETVFKKRFFRFSLPLKLGSLPQNRIMIDEVNSQSNSRGDASETLWIFGYGSLIWKPDFPFQYCVVGHIDGYVRRFWQGSIWHRGDANKVKYILSLVCGIARNYLSYASAYTFIFLFCSPGEWPLWFRKNRYDLPSRRVKTCRVIYKVM